MWKTFIRRLILLVPQLIGVSLIIFFLAELMPGDALSGMFREDPTMTQEQIDALRMQYGLYGPWYSRYITWVGNMLRGDFGTSLSHRRPVTELVGERMGNTVLLSSISVVIIYFFALPLGIIAGKYKGKTPEKVITFYNFVQMAIPMVVFALVLQWIFAIGFGVFPLRGSVDVNVIRDGGYFEVLFSRIHHAILPALSMSLLAGVGIIQFLANEINDQKELDYVTTARAKGVPLRDIYKRHIFRNSLLPIAANFGPIVVGLFGGAVIIENMFTYNGMGRLFVTSISGQDWPVVNFLVIFYGALTILGFLLSDIALTVFDPRIRIK